MSAQASLVSRALKSKDARIAALEDQVEYLEAQLMDQDVKFPDAWPLTPSERKVLRQLLKLRVAKQNSLLAALYSERGGDEPEPNVIRVLISRMRRNLLPFGIKIKTVRGEGYSLSPEMKARIKSLCDTEQEGSAA